MQGRDPATAADHFARSPGVRPSPLGPDGDAVETLRVVWCTRAGCGRVLMLCRWCYRGQRYCGDECRELSRREQCRRAEGDYLAKLAGRRRPAAASAAYRQRRRADSPPEPAEKIVIDQGLPPEQAGAYSSPHLAYCARCGRPGWTRFEVPPPLSVRPEERDGTGIAPAGPAVPGTAA